jgi:predicted lactoylglutathione lyase
MAQLPNLQGNDFVKEQWDYIITAFARERGDVDEAHNFLVNIGAKIVHEPREDGFAPGYYSVLFEDPDGTRLEINHVPGKGLLAPDMQIGGGYADGAQNG